MPKRVFWPAALVTMGLVFLASNLGFLPREFWNLWPIILIAVGLGGLLTSDSEEWDVTGKTTPKKSVTKKVASKKTSAQRRK